MSKLRRSGDGVHLPASLVADRFFDLRTCVSPKSVEASTVMVRTVNMLELNAWDFGNLGILS